MRISKDIVTISIVGAGSRATGYINALEKYYSGKFKVVAVADPVKSKRDYFQKIYDIKEDNLFENYQEFNKQDRLSDVVIIGTLDDIHYEPAVSALKKGYDIILEKPISMSLEESVAIGNLAEKYPNQMVAVCHVLRHSPMFRKIKEIIDSKVLGEVVDIQHNENIGYYHFAHSYVRGNWRNTDISAPISVAKTCHDFDILLYFLGNDVHCTSLSSMGDLKFFNHQHYDETKMAKKCADCKVEKDCPYSAIKIYTAKMIRSVVFDDSTTESLINNLNESGYGRCVFACDNNVPDHQVTIMSFDNGVHATFNMSAFTKEISRTLKVMFEYGELRAREKPKSLEITRFGGETQIIELPETSGGHNGADEGFVQNFMESYLYGKPFDSSISASIESHVMAFAAEDSRAEKGQLIDIKSYWNDKKIVANKLLKGE